LFVFREDKDVVVREETLEAIMRMSLAPDAMEMVFWAMETWFTSVSTIGAPLERFLKRLLRIRWQSIRKEL
jgi:hypothetical protein